MNRLPALIGGVVLGAMAWAGAASAQNLVISNARIIDGTGRVIERGSVAVRDGRIASVGEGAAPAIAGAQRIDAQGMTVLAGYIDTHRHLIRGEAKAWLAAEAPARMKEFLEAGFTTVASMGDDPVGIIELRRRLAAGELLGPTLFAARVIPLSAPMPAVPGAPPGPRGDPARADPARDGYRSIISPPAIPEAQTRAAVRAAKAAGFDAIKTILVTTSGGPEGPTLAIIADEAHKQGLRVFTHATNVIDSVVAVNAGVDVLAHTPHSGRLEENEAALKRIVAAKIPMESTLAVFVPHFDDQNHPLFRDNGPFPFGVPLASGGQGPVNSRLMWQEGLVYAFGTDTTWNPRESLSDELRALNAMYSGRDIIKIMGPNSAATLNEAKDIGTLEPGKIADIVIIRGDPLADVQMLTRVAMVVKGGKLVVDKR